MNPNKKQLKVKRPLLNAQIALLSVPQYHHATIEQNYSIITHNIILGDKSLEYSH